MRAIEETSTKTIPAGKGKNVVLSQAHPLRPLKKQGANVTNRRGENGRKKKSTEWVERNSLSTIERKKEASEQRTLTVGKNPEILDHTNQKKKREKTGCLEKKKTNQLRWADKRTGVEQIRKTTTGPITQIKHFGRAKRTGNKNHCPAQPRR